MDHENGFEIAEIDLKLRGPGDILGLRQSGLPRFAIGDFVNDQTILRCAREDAEKLLEDSQHTNYPLVEYCRRFAEGNEGVD